MTMIRARGLRRFSADVLVSNEGTLMMFCRSRLTVRSRIDSTSHHLAPSSCYPWRAFRERLGQWP